MSSKKSVLVVDDNPTVTRFVTAVLRPMGYRVDAAANGIEAIKRLTQGPADLILLDLVMPKMNGVQFCMAVQQKKLAENTNIVLLSSAEQKIAERVLKATQAVAFLPKPVREQELKAVVVKYLPLQADPGGQEVEIDIGEEEEFSIDLGSEEDRKEEFTSDDAASGPMDLTSMLRDKLDNAVAAGLAGKLDEILAAKTRGEVLDLIAEALAKAVDDRLVNIFIELVRKTPEEG